MQWQQSSGITQGRQMTLVAPRNMKFFPLCRCAFVSAKKKKNNNSGRSPTSEVNVKAGYIKSPVHAVSANWYFAFLMQNSSCCETMSKIMQWSWSHLLSLLLASQYKILHVIWTPLRPLSCRCVQPNERKKKTRTKAQCKTLRCASVPTCAWVITLS